MGIFDALNPLNLVSKIADAADRFVRTGDDKDKFNLEVLGLVQARDSEVEQTVRTEMEAKQQVIVSELQQGDKYTKRARPTIVYGGLLVLLINHVILPWVAFYVGMEVPKIEIPNTFWMGWSGIVATWSIGRTAERRGLQSKLVSAITGG